MLMKARDDGTKPGTPPEAAAQPSGPGPSKIEKEGQRPTQPVYQIQNRGMGASASISAVDRKLLYISFFFSAEKSVTVMLTLLNFTQI